MADEALFLLLHNEMVSGVYKSAEQGEVVSAATHPGVLRRLLPPFLSRPADVDAL